MNRTAAKSAAWNLLGSTPAARRSLRRRQEPSLMARYGISPDLLVALTAVLACPLALVFAFMG